TPGDARGHEALVTVRDLHVTFPRRPRDIHAVAGLNMTIRPGEAVGIVGESGSGKSVTVRSLLGLAGRGAIVEADTMEVFGRDAMALPERRWRSIRGGRIGLVLQDALVSLDPMRTVGREVDEALRLHTTATRRDRARRVVELLAEVGMPNPEYCARRHPHELSGGLRQRALIASAIAGEPDLIVADEPTTALDVTVQAQILDLLASRQRAGTALLLVSHDLAVVAAICERVLVMKGGAVVEAGPTRDILTAPATSYTRTLLAAVPSAATRGHALSSLERRPLPQRTVDRDRVVLRADAVSRDFTAPGEPTCHAVREVSAEVRAGETLGIVGESGSGKSTLARILAGLLEPSAGRVLLNGRPWAPLPDRARRDRRRLVQVIAQDPLSSFDPRYSARQVLAEPLRGLGLDHAEVGRRVDRIASLVALTDVPLDASPRRYSGGERQRLAIGRALIGEPAVLVADEPVSALDVSVQAQILDLLAILRAKTGTSVVFISHDLGVVHHLADRVIVMKDGWAVETGPADQVFDRPRHPYTRELLAAVPKLPLAVACP
ncbi:MAG: ABC transporter ATP-binding protein, partial [Bifidobacteriaceae bacterium]|nr:ABC transporter ATP-binding protein [Bifidobacteriaceae bacterium]